LAAGVAALHLRSAPPLFEVAGRLFLSLVDEILSAMVDREEGP
jgi:hypothetical protein